VPDGLEQVYVESIHRPAVVAQLLMDRLLHKKGFNVGGHAFTSSDLSYLDRH
jgi:hypothetical protein